MSSLQNLDQERLQKWLDLLDGPGWEGQEARNRAVNEMRAIGVDQLFPLLMQRLYDPNSEIRCQASEAIVWIDAKQGVELLLPLLNDSDSIVRWHVCGLMHDFGDERAIEPLIEQMRNDPDPQVRGTAAYALGGIGNLSAIPALVDTLNSDHEVDQLGHTPSSSARGAIEVIQRGN